MVTCPNGGHSGHRFCQAIGCDFCVATIADMGHIRFECDGMRDLTPIMNATEAVNAARKGVNDSAVTIGANKS